MSKDCSNCIYKNREWGDNPCRTCDEWDNWVGVDEYNPVICAECICTGKIVELKDGEHLTCELKNNKAIYGSKPKWCPLIKSKGENK